MKFGMNLLLWTGHLDESIMPVLDRLKSMGYDGVEVPMFELDEKFYAEWGKRLDKIGLRRTAVTVRTEADNPISPDAAVRYVRAQAAQFRIDPTRIASLGFSAGGHLATMLALRPDPRGTDGRVSIAVNLDGEHDLTMPPDKVMSDFDNIVTGVLGHPAPWSQAELTDLSTVTFARGGVSVLTIHGVNDDNVYYPQAERITAALTASGADTRLVRVDGDDGFCHESCWKTAHARRAILEFLNGRLRHDGTAYFESVTKGN